MQEILQKHKEELKQIFEKEGVVLAYLFGSQARGTASPQSDVDIAVLFSGKVPEEEQFEKSLTIGAEATLLLHKDADIINLRGAPPLLKHRAVLHGTPIFVTNAELKRGFELRVLQEHEDFSYHLKKSHNIILKRIREQGLGKPYLSALKSNYLKRYVAG